MIIRHLTPALAAGACILSTSALAQTPADAPATLVVTVELKSTGVQRPKSGEKNVTWTVAHTFTTTTKLKADKAQGSPQLHKPNPGQQAANERAAKAAEKAASDAEPLMAQAEKIFEKCGDDEACIERETLKLAGSLDKEKTAAAGKSAAEAAEAADKAVPKGTRYQNFRRGAATGVYKIDEVAHEAYFDAACSTRNEASCSIDTVVRGEGALESSDGKTALPAAAWIEVDHQTGTAIVMLTGFGIGKATKTVKSGAPERPSGSSEVKRTSLPEGFGSPMLEGKCSAGCATASGSFTKETIEPLLRQPATLTISWKFTQP